MLCRIKTGITSGLGQMLCHRTFHFLKVSVGTLDLVNLHRVSFDHTVCTAFHPDGNIFKFTASPQTYFRMIR